MATVVTKLLAAAGPVVLGVSPTEVRNATFDHIDVDFDRAIDAATFTTADVSVVGPVGVRTTMFGIVLSAACASPRT